MGWEKTRLFGDQLCNVVLIRRRSEAPEGSERERGGDSCFSISLSYIGNAQLDSYFSLIPIFYM